MNKSGIYTIVLSVLISSLMAVGIHYFLGGAKIVYVDSARLLNNYKGMQAARKSYELKAAAWKANIDTLANEIQNQITRYEKEGLSMTAKEKELMRELIKTKQTGLMDYQRALNTQAQQEDSKMTTEIISQINAYIKKYGTRKGYKVIIAATEYGNVAYADEELDITEEVLAGLNKEYSGL